MGHAIWALLHDKTETMPWDRSRHSYIYTLRVCIGNMALEI